MRRKSGAQQPVIPKEILDEARKAFQMEQSRPVTNCVVCGSECAPNSSEELCWVCRRLKISAWRDSEQQIPAQE